jgi:hypothetical protein
LNIFGTSGITNIYSSAVNLTSPVLDLGGIVPPTSNDGQDRGIQYRYFQNGQAYTGFFGFQNSTQRIVSIPDALNLFNVFYGSYGNVQFGNGYFTNIDLSSGSGSIGGVTSITSNTKSNSLVISSDNIELSGNTLIPFNDNVYFGNSSNSLITTQNTTGTLTSLTSLTTNILALNATNYIQVGDTTPIYFGGPGESISNSSGTLVIQNTSGGLNLNSSTYVKVLDQIPILFGSTSDQIYSSSGSLNLIGYDGVNINSGSGPGGGTKINGDLNVIGNISGVSTDLDLNRFILPLGTSQTLIITSIQNSSTLGVTTITTDTNNYVTTGNFVTLTNTSCQPPINGTFIVTNALSPNTFLISTGTQLILDGTFGNFKSNLTTFQGKDVGIQVNYWTTAANTITTTSGSVNYANAFFGYKLNLNEWVFYNTATIANNVVSGNLGTIAVGTVNTNYLSGFTLNGPAYIGSNAISGSNFIISGGTIDNTPIGTNIAQSGRFNILSNTVSASFQNVNLLSAFSLSVERYTLNSGIPSRNPSLNTVVSFVSVSGVSFNSYGTLGNINVNDGQLKYIVASSIGTNCTYSLNIANLIATNRGNNNTAPSTILFNSSGQSIQLLFDNNLLGWLIVGGRGAGNIS